MQEPDIMRSVVFIRPY